MFHSSTYIERRGILKHNLKSGLIILPGNQLSAMNYRHNYFPFRQDSTFLYYFGLDLPDLVGIIDVDENKATIYGDELTMDDIVWTGPMPTIAKLAKKAGVENTAPSRQIEVIIREAISKNRNLHFLPPYRASQQFSLSEWTGIPHGSIQEKASVRLIMAVVDQRSIKSDDEIVEIEKAMDITSKMHLAMMKKARPGMKEEEIVGIIKGLAIRAGGYVSFPPIVSIHGEILHNTTYLNTLQEGKLLLGDFGAEAPSHYAGDITRTIPVSNRFTTKQTEIYNIVLNAQESAIEILMPGIEYKEVHLLAARRLVEGLSDLGIMKGDRDEAVALGAHALFMPHGLGHMMGLDVHDMENLGENYVGYDISVQRSTQFGLSALRLGRKLQTGFVLTVEPGIYFIPDLISKWKKEGINKEFINFEKLESYYDFGGIRIEDDVLITDNGHWILGTHIPKSVEDVEAMREK